MIIWARKKVIKIIISLHYEWTLFFLLTHTLSVFLVHNSVGDFFLLYKIVLYHHPPLEDFQVRFRLRAVVYSFGSSTFLKVWLHCSEWVEIIIIRLRPTYLSYTMGSTNNQRWKPISISYYNVFSPFTLMLAKTRFAEKIPGSFEVNI